MVRRCAADHVEERHRHMVACCSNVRASSTPLLPAP
jgi:hypothetical protein